MTQGREKTPLQTTALHSLTVAAVTMVMLSRKRHYQLLELEAPSLP